MDELQGSCQWPIVGYQRLIYRDNRLGAFIKAG